MAITRVKQWSNGEVLTHTDLNAEFDNILVNSTSLISPLTANLSVGNFDLTSVGNIGITTGGDITNLDELALRDAATTASAVGRLRRNGLALHWHDLTGSVAIPTMVGGSIFGLTLSNAAGDPTNDITIAAGVATDSTEALNMRLTSTITKQLDAAWAVGTNAGGLDTGAIANGTYHVFLIMRVDTGVVDVLFSASATAPTMPTNYTLFRRIGSILREAAAIVLFTQVDNLFLRTTPTGFGTNNPGTAAVLQAFGVPLGINVLAQVHWQLDQTSAQQNVMYVSAPAQTDTAPTVGSGFSTLVTGAAGVAGTTAGYVETITNTSAQVRYRLSFSDASTNTRGICLGWVDRRNQDV